MPFARNPLDGNRTYYEDAGGEGSPMLFMYGLMDPVPAAKALRIARRLETMARVIYVDHRGHGRSDKPHDPAAYSLDFRTADVVSVIDALGQERVHFAGISWGARLGFALGARAPERLHSLILNGNQPYAWDPSWHIVQILNDAMLLAREGGTQALLRWFEELIGRPLPRRERQWLLDNDALALDAAWNSALNEGDIADDFSGWRVPTLVAAGDEDEFYENARRAAATMPTATFVSLSGRDHLGSIDEVDRLIPAIQHLLAASA